MHYTEVPSDSYELENDHKLDPRIKEELDKLNAASSEINTLEKELDEARSKFRITLSESSGKLNSLLKKHKNSITKSRLYYETLALAKQTQSETQLAAVQYRRASSFYKAAKETIALAEQRLNDEDVQFDAAWQEMMNHSTIKMMDAEKEKMRSELEHHRKSLKFQQVEQKLHDLERDSKRSIAKARSYFELKAALEIQLQQQKQNVDDLHSCVSAAKMKYRAAMSSLEKISQEIHMQRQVLAFPREPGVGCDSDSDEDLSLEINLEKHLNITAGGEDAASTDADSLFSYDSDSVKFAPDGSSLQSVDCESAAGSPPKWLTRDRDDTLRCDADGNSAESQGSNDTVIDKIVKEAV